jgi:hypothetical protein
MNNTVHYISQMSPAAPLNYVVVVSYSCIHVEVERGRPLTRCASCSTGMWLDCPRIRTEDSRLDAAENVTAVVCCTVATAAVCCTVAIVPTAAAPSATRAASVLTERFRAAGASSNAAIAGCGIAVVSSVVGTVPSAAATAPTTAGSAALAASVGAVAAFHHRST